MDTKGRWTPNSKLPVKRVISLLFYVVSESPFETVILLENIRKYQCIYKHRDTKGRWIPHSKLPVKRVISLLFYVVNETPFETVNL